MLGSRKVTTLGGDVFRDEYSLAFDGTNDYIQIPSTTFNIHNSTHSFVFWAKRSAIDSWDIILGNSAHGNYDFILFDEDDGDRIILEGSDGDFAIGACSVVADVWYHFVVVTNGDGTAAMYQDGVPISVTYDGGGDLGSAMTIDNIGGSSSGNHLTGSISEVAIYNTALTASQAKTLYNGREPYNHKEGIASGNLTHWWRMGDGTLDKGSLDRAGDDTGLICDEVNPTLGAELVSNGDFDDETNYTDYLMEGGDTADLSTEQVLVGSNSLKIDVSNAGEGTKLGGVATTTGKTYRISAWFYVTAGTAKINPGDDKWSPNGLEPKTNVTNEWQQLVMYNTADTDEANAWIYFQAGSNSSVFYLDNVSVREVQGNPGIFLNSDTQFTGDTP